MPGYDPLPPPTPTVAVIQEAQYTDDEEVDKKQLAPSTPNLAQSTPDCSKSMDVLPMPVDSKLEPIDVGRKEGMAGGKLMQL